MTVPTPAYIFFAEGSGPSPAWFASQGVAASTARSAPRSRPADDAEATFGTVIGANAPPRARGSRRSQKMTLGPDPAVVGSAAHELVHT